MEKAAIENVSDTAFWVANFRALESQRPDALYHDPFAARLAGERGREIARAMPHSAVIAWIMVVRTVAIDRLILDAIANGTDTVVNLGAGLDTRPYRLNLPKTLRWIEIDFPHLIELKTERLAAEVPRCELIRKGLDLSDRSKARQAYAEIGTRTPNALILTEGVVPYLTNEQAADLACDLRSIPSFRYWILDYRKSGASWRQPRSLRKKLRNAPFRFEHPDPLAFFAKTGWMEAEDIWAVDEGERLGRPFPVPFPWKLFVRFLPKAQWDRFRGGYGYVLLRAGERT